MSTKNQLMCSMMKAWRRVRGFSPEKFFEKMKQNKAVKHFEGWSLDDSLQLGKQGNTDVTASVSNNVPSSLSTFWNFKHKLLFHKLFCAMSQFAVIYVWRVYLCHAQWICFYFPFLTFYYAKSESAGPFMFCDCRLYVFKRYVLEGKTERGAENAQERLKRIIFDYCFSWSWGDGKTDKGRRDGVPPASP